MKTRILFLLAHTMSLTAMSYGIETPKDTAPAPALQEKLAEKPLEEGKRVPFAQDIGALDQKTPYLGVINGALPPELMDHLGLKEGIIVRSVQPNGPAAKANLKANDLILKVKGQSVVSPQDFSTKIAQCQPGENVELEILRKGKSEKCQVTLCDRPNCSEPLSNSLLGGGISGISDLDQLDEAQMSQIKQLIERQLGTLIPKDRLNDMLQGEDIAAPLNAARERLEKAIGDGKLSFPSGVHFESSSSTSIRDADGSLLTVTQSGKEKQVELKDVEGKSVWSGPWNTEAEKAAAPQAIQDQMKRFQDQQSAGPTSTLRKLQLFLGK